MNTLFRIVIGLFVITGLLTLIGLLIPVQMAGNVNDSIVYFLGYINYLKPLSPNGLVALIDCLAILVKFYFLMAYLLFIIIILKFIV